MNVRNYLIALTVFICALGVAASDYVLVQFPITATSSDSTIWIKWAGAATRSISILPPDSGKIYFSRTPGGSVIANYPYVITPDSNNKYEPPVGITAPAKRGISFRPKNQSNMLAGVFYYIVALTTKKSNWQDSAIFISNEMTMIIETPLATTPVGPTGDIASLTPTFSWQANPGVPYYHVLLSDEEIKIGSSSSDTGSNKGSVGLSGLSIVWQAITPSTQIVYGAPDPSGTITASPPPMSPGKTYSWVVLNNYGNHPAYTSTKFGLPKNFILLGDTLKKPINSSPANDTVTSKTDSIITFKWRNLDSKANTYKIYVYVAQKVQGVSAQLVVWENEVTAGSFTGDEGSVSVNASSIFTKNIYTWKVMAVDNKGAARGGEQTSFRYYSKSGKMKVYTKENIVTGANTIITPVSAAEIKIEVLSGSMEAPLLFYTDGNGQLDRDRPAGNYRVTAIKSGFDPVTKTVTLDTTGSNDTFYLRRPDATVFGQVTDQSEIGINLATVTGVSYRGDTVTAKTDALGSFIINCYEGTWRLWAEKTGYITSLSRDTLIRFGQSISLGKVKVDKNPFSISGTVKNEKGDALVGANVKLYNQGILYDEVPSTAQSGAFSFSVNSGTYTLTATKTGFTSYNATFDVLSSKQINATMPAGSALLTGYVIGRSYIDTIQVFAPITKANILFIDTTKTPADTFSTVSDATYGDYRASIPGARKYVMSNSVSGFVPKRRVMEDSIKQGSTVIYNDTLVGLAMFTGRVQDTLSAGLGNVTLSVVKASNQQILTSVRSQTDGKFEIRNLANDTVIIRAGKDGYVQGAVTPSDTLFIADGRVKIKGQSHARNLTITMKAGSKTIKWSVESALSATATILLQSPLQKILNSTDTLAQAGAGRYTLSATSGRDSVLDIAYHEFTVADSLTSFIDSLRFPVRHQRSDTLKILNDSISVVLTSTVSMDSVRIYFKDVSNPAFLSTVRTAAATTNTFRIKPPKDGSNMYYYFVAYSGVTRYGSDQKQFRSFVEPNKKLSMLELVPSSNDTLEFPAQYVATFSFQGYYGSTFIRDTAINATSIRWTVSNGSCQIAGNGLTAKVTTPASGIATAVRLTAKVDTSITRLMIGVPDSISCLFTVSGNSLDSIRLIRVDADNPNAITSSANAKAEFVAVGVDTAGEDLSISPTWRCEPAAAGNVSTRGVFSPAQSFVGLVRIIAMTGSLAGEYFNGDEKGLRVSFNIVEKSTPDTASNRQGCTVIFPDSVVGASSPGKLQIAMPVFANTIQTESNDLNVVSPIYDITELNGVALSTRRGNIKVVLDVPKLYIERAKASGRTLFVGVFNEDSLGWDTLSSTVASSDGKTLTANAPHFSKYAVIATAGNLAGDLSISPNPFSPYVAPTRIGDFGLSARKGTCIKFRVDAPVGPIQVKIRIYNILGDLVWSVSKGNALKSSEYRLWWNGKTTTHEEIWFGDESQIIAGEKMCRNGRYFVIMTVIDGALKEKNYMKQIILIK